MSQRPKISLPPAAKDKAHPRRDRPPVRGAGSAPRKRAVAGAVPPERDTPGGSTPAEPRDPAARPRPAQAQAAARSASPPAAPQRGAARGAGAPYPASPQRPAAQHGKATHGAPAAPQRAAARGAALPPAVLPQQPGAKRSDTARHTPAAPGAGPAPARLAAPVVKSDDTRPRLSKRMSELGLASRREADEWIAAGFVSVDGQQVTELGVRVSPEARISVDPAARLQQAQRVTVLLNKPIGYVSGQAEDGYEPAVVLVTPQNHWAGDKSGTRYQGQHLRGLAPAGRLDIDSTGLLVLTQDGRIARHLIGEDSTVEKEYLVRVQYGRPGRLPDVVPAEDLQLLRHGLSLDGKQLQPAKVSWQNEDQLRFVLREGRKRQIRRMCEAVGLKVVGLRRIRIGSVVLGDLPVGQWRYLRDDERF
ncbi:pseudouridine synthase [Eleftheria terrae]|uniref:pseudouridine synthase n=1 Tax=Eleftheria terrae TaxID=1597781 RepID=UPI00263A9B58|nr:pseudouridine synthase [Eleftheria terrae]WKB55341.1 rRNA pseudouridine synthase [Eleftheria terrae]